MQSVSQKNFSLDKVERISSLKRIARSLKEKAAVKVGVVICAIALSASLGSACGGVSTTLQFDNNWSGYYVTGSDISYVSSSWTVPRINAGKSGNVSEWVGIGGAGKGRNLIQDGVVEGCADSANSKKCTPYYYTFIELFPNQLNAQVVGRVRPGDVVSASVKEVEMGVWKMSISDKTEGYSFTTNVDFDPNQQSAEAIVERPSQCKTASSCTLEPFTNFGTVHFVDTEAVNSTTYFNQLKYGISDMEYGQGVNATVMSVSGITGLGNFSVTY